MKVVFELHAADVVPFANIPQGFFVAKPPAGGVDQKLHLYLKIKNNLFAFGGEGLDGVSRPMDISEDSTPSRTFFQYKPVDVTITVKPLAYPY